MGATRGAVTPAARLAGLVGAVGDTCDEMNLRPAARLAGLVGAGAVGDTGDESNVRGWKEGDIKESGDRVLKEGGEADYVN